MNKYEKRVVFSAEEIAREVQLLARSISEDYEGKEVVLIGVLKGAFIFLADLVRQLTIPVQLDFIRAASYGTGTESSGKIRITTDVELDLRGRDVLIVEDIIDSGRTLDYMRRNLLARNPKSLRICSLLNKPSRREIDVEVEYLGFDIPDEFVVGYGLDFDELYRNLPFIAVLKPEVFAHLLEG